MSNPIKNGQIARSLYNSIKNGIAIDNIPGLICQMIDEEMWSEVYIEEIDDKKRFDSFREFMTTPPPEGLGTDAETLTHLVSHDMAALSKLDKVLDRHAGAPKGNSNASKHKTTDYNVNNCFDRPTGNTSQAGLRRLRSEILKASDPEKKRMLQDTQQRVLAHEVSVNAALVSLGIRRPTMTISIDPESAAKSIKRKFSQDQLRQLVDLLQP